MKKIAVSTAKAFLAEHKNDDTITKTYPIGESEFALTIKTRLTVAEKSVFISRVLSGCFDATRNFRPEYITPMFRATVIQMCTNIPVVSLKGDKDDSGAALMDIGAMDELYRALDLDRIDDAQYQAMLDEIVQLTNATIEWERNKRIAQMRNARLSKIIDGINDLIDALTEKVNSLDTESLMQYAEKLTKQTESLGDDNIVKAVFDLHAQESASAGV